MFCLSFGLAYLSVRIFSMRYDVGTEISKKTKFVIKMNYQIVPNVHVYL